jgi:hypothetical protein
MIEASRSDDRKLLSATVLIASLGYFVDMYDMFVFNIVRRNSLSDLGLADALIVTKKDSAWRHHAR